MNEVVTSFIARKLVNGETVTLTEKEKYETNFHAISEWTKFTTRRGEFGSLILTPNE